jgi:DNA-binding transcriptional LysR family regulator
MPRLPEFLARHPDLEMEVVLDDRHIDLVQGGIDVALRMGQLADSAMTARRIATTRHAVIGMAAYFARAGEPRSPGELIAHEAVIYSQRGGGAVWTFHRDGAELAVTVKGRLHVTAAEGVRAAVLADAGLAIASEWMFAPELAAGTVRAVLRDWDLPSMDLWAVYPAGRTATTKARTFIAFVEEVMQQPVRSGSAL